MIFIEKDLFSSISEYSYYEGLPNTFIGSRFHIIIMDDETPTTIENFNINLIILFKKNLHFIRGMFYATGSLFNL